MMGSLLRQVRVATRETKPNHRHTHHFHVAHVTLRVSPLSQEIQASFLSPIGDDIHVNDATVSTM